MLQIFKGCGARGGRAELDTEGTSGAKMCLMSGYNSPDLTPPSKDALLLEYRDLDY